MVGSTWVLSTGAVAVGGFLGLAQLASLGKSASKRFTEILPQKVIMRKTDKDISMLAGARKHTYTLNSFHGSNLSVGKIQTPEPIIKMLSLGENLCNYSTDKRLMSRIPRELQKSKTNRKNNPINNWEMNVLNENKQYK